MNPPTPELFYRYLIDVRYEEEHRRTMARWRIGTIEVCCVWYGEEMWLFEARKHGELLTNRTLVQLNALQLQKFLESFFYLYRAFNNGEDPAPLEVPPFDSTPLWALLPVPETVGV